MSAGELAFAFLEQIGFRLQTKLLINILSVEEVDDGIDVDGKGERIEVVNEKMINFNDHDKLLLHLFPLLPPYAPNNLKNSASSGEVKRGMQWPLSAKSSPTTKRQKVTAIYLPEPQLKYRINFLSQSSCHDYATIGSFFRDSLIDEDVALHMSSSYCPIICTENLTPLNRLSHAVVLFTNSRSTCKPLIEHRMAG
ncbi:hypothetical protein ACLOJK_018632 [Asimina triloba]